MAEAKNSEKGRAPQHLEMIKPVREGKGPLGGCMSGKKDERRDERKESYKKRD